MPILIRYLALRRIAGINNAWDENWEHFDIVAQACESECFDMTFSLQLDERCRMKPASLSLKRE